MNDKNTLHNDEYQYPEDEYVIEAKTTTPHVEESNEEVVTKKPPQQSALKDFITTNKRKLLTVVLVIAALIIFQVSKHEKNNKVIMKAPQQNVVQPVQDNSNEVQLQKSLTDMQQINDRNNQEIAKLKDQQDALTQQLNQANQTNEQLKQAMILLLQEMRDLHQTMDQKPASKDMGPPKPKLVYFVRAVVDGRAWILGSNGLAESVTIGDPIPGYGNVTAIDPARGVVTTTTGKEIRLGLNDY